MKWKSVISERTIIIAIIFSILVVGGLICYAFAYILNHIQNWWWIVGIVLYFILLEATIIGVLYILSFKIINFSDKILL